MMEGGGKVGGGVRWRGSLAVALAESPAMHRIALFAKLDDSPDEPSHASSLLAELEL
jgi:hypothetical protein